MYLKTQSNKLERPSTFLNKKRSELKYVEFHDKLYICIFKNHPFAILTLIEGSISHSLDEVMHHRYC